MPPEEYQKFKEKKDKKCVEYSSDRCNQQNTLWERCDNYSRLSSGEGIPCFLTSLYSHLHFSDSSTYEDYLRPNESFHRASYLSDLTDDEDAIHINVMRDFTRLENAR